MLLYAALAAEGLGNHGGGIVVAVAGQIANFYLGIGQSGLDTALDLTCVHGHVLSPAGQ
ncbi:hypothetical protein D3C87_2122360 [compost metagenome]